MSKRNQGHEDSQGSVPSAFKRRKLERKGDDSHGSPHVAAARLFLHDDYTVGWICALPLEMAAAKAMLDNIHTDLPNHPNDHNTYTLGRIGAHNVVVACLPSGVYGTTSASIVATQMQFSFRSIQFGLMVGIGGGVPSREADIRLGDIVVSTPSKEFGGVVQYDYGKTVREGRFERIGTLNKPPQALLTAVAKLKADHMQNDGRLLTYLSRIVTERFINMPNFTHRGKQQDRLFQAEYDHVWLGDTCDDCDTSRIVARPTRPTSGPMVHYGLIASANQVMKHGATRDRLAQQLGILCFEMEAAALMDHIPCLVIRGICDYADSHKNKHWQEYAAATAAAYARKLLSVVPVKQVAEPQVATATSNAERISKILHWLTSINSSALQRNNIAQRQDGTGLWLLNSKEFKTWVEGKEQTLFCPGIPGAGKTIMSSIVVENLQKTFSHDDTVSIACLFCSYKNQNKEKSVDLFASLLKQLVQENPVLPKAVEALYEIHNKKNTRPSLDELSEALRLVVDSYSRVFFVIDALDECENTDRTREHLLGEIFKLQKQTKTSLFATSRFIPDIENAFKGSVSLEIRASNEDMRRYLDGHMPTQACISRDPDLQEEIKTKIIRATGGMFLLAQLHLDSLKDKMRRKAIRQALERLPNGLDRAYEDTMERIKDKEKGLRELAKQVLSWIICTMRPLTTLELRHALAVEVGESALDEENFPEIEDMVSVCAGLVTVDEESNIIRLVHYTTQEYFDRTWISWFPGAQTDIATTCITYLSFDAFEAGFCPTDDVFEKRLQLNPLYDYAARNWGHHAQAASAEVEHLKLDLLIVGFLESEAKVSGCSQAMMASRRYSWESGYCQNVPTRMTGVHLAAYFGLKATTITLLRNEHNPNVKDSYGWTSLSYAAARGHEAVVQLLLEKGADLDSKDTEFGRTPLSYAAENGHKAVVRLLLDKGADLDSKDKSGETPLSYATENGREAVVRLLLKKGADLDSKDKSGQTPLSYAAARGHEAVVRLLLEKGADLDSQDKYGRTPLSLAAANGREAVVELLLEKDADLDSKDKSGQTPLFYAARNGHEAVVQLLLEKGADLDSKDTELGRTPLSYAAENGHKAVVRLLLKKGADLDSKDKYGQTPLSYAAARGHEAVVRLLLEKGADLDSQDKYGQTPLSYAARNRYEVMFRLLLRKGAKKS